MKRLDQWLSGEALATAPEGDWQKLRRWIRMHPRTTRFAVATLVSAVVVTLGSLTAYLKVDVALHRTSIERDVAERKRQELSLAASRNLAEFKLAEERLQDQQKSLQELEQQYQQLKPTTIGARSWAKPPTSVCAKRCVKRGCRWQNNSIAEPSI